MVYDLIIVNGAPGSGKTTISKLLHKRLDSVFIDFGDNLRTPHLDILWKRASNKEENMTFENLAFILKNYIKNGYKDIIITDLSDEKVLKLAKIFLKNKVLIITLLVDNKELEKRVINPKRDSGFRNVKKAIEHNKQIIERKQLKNEIRIDNNQNNPKNTIKKIIKIIQPK